VTGANGFLGSNLIRSFLNQGYTVKALRRANSSFSRLQDITEKICWHTIENSKKENFNNFFQEVDCVIHTAASYGRSGESVLDIALANTIFGLEVLSASVQKNVMCFINTNSALPKSTNSYTLSKAHFAEWGKQYSENNEIKFINIKLEHMYGPGDDTVKFTEYVINSCLNNIATLDLTVGLQKRDFIYIDDVVSAFSLLIKRQHELKCMHYDIELGSGETITIKSLVEKIHLITQSKTKLNFGAIPTKGMDVQFSCANIAFLNNLGWRPKTSLAAGLLKTIKAPLRQLTHN
jgi:CDP-paratose synthetase